MTGHRFFFRAWLLPDDPPEISTWSHELDPMDPAGRPVSEWALEHLQDLDLYGRLGLDPTKAWQVVGRGAIKGWYSDASQEWDEAADLDVDAAAEIPGAYLDAIFGPDAAGEQ